MKYLMIVIALLLTGCSDYSRSHYVYPEFVQKATEFCEINGGVERLVITSSYRPGHVNAGAWGYVDCNNTARFEFNVAVIRNTEE